MSETARPSPPGATARDAAYAHYVQLKGWVPFVYSAEDAETFQGELGTRNLSGISLLEIGFGAGALLAWAMDCGATVAGAEFNPDCLAEARLRGVELVPPDLVAHAPEYQGRFDVIVAFDVFEHFELDEVRRNLEACATMLKADGRLLLRFPNSQSPFGLLHQHADITHKTPLSGDHMRQLVVGTALEVAAVRPAHRTRGPTLGRKIVRSVRFMLQDLVQRLVGFIYVYTVPLAPVITVELRRRTGPGAVSAPPASPGVS